MIRVYDTNALWRYDEIITFSRQSDFKAEPIDPLAPLDRANPRPEQL